MTIMQTIKTAIGATALFFALTTGAMADDTTPKSSCVAITSEATACVAVDADSLKKFLEDQPKAARFVVPVVTTSW